MGGLLFYTGVVITFVVKNIKAIGIALLIIGVIAMIITNGWGLIAYAGIVALRHRVNSAH